MDIGAVVVVLLDDEIRRVDVIHPVRHILGVIVLMLPGDGVHQHSPVDVRAAKESDGFSDRGQTQ